MILVITYRRQQRGHVVVPIMIATILAMDVVFTWLMPFYHITILPNIDFFFQSQWPSVGMLQFN